MVVVICCGCCFLQSTIAFVILLPNIYIRRCYISINFALMQFCLSVTATMSFIILSLLKFLPQVSRIAIQFEPIVCLKIVNNEIASKRIEFPIVKFFKVISFHRANFKWLPTFSRGNCLLIPCRKITRLEDRNWIMFIHSLLYFSVQPQVWIIAASRKSETVKLLLTHLVKRTCSRLYNEIVKLFHS